MLTSLPRDNKGEPIPALRLKTSGAHAISATGTSARNSSAFDDNTAIVSVFSTVPVYLAFGGSDVTADSADHYFPAGIYYDFAIRGDNTGGYTHLAVLSADSDGTVYVSEKI